MASAKLDLRTTSQLASCLLAGVLGAASCGSATPMEGSPAVDAGTAALTTPTFHKDIEPLLQRHCLTCHSPGRIAPFPLVTYQDARNSAGLIATQTKSGTMPPWGARETSECKPRHSWKADIRLSAAEIATLERWSQAGAPEGDVKDAPAAYVPPVSGLPGMQVELQPAKPFVTGGPTDQFRCFVIDPRFTETKYLNGWHFIAGNPKVVHHALMFLNEDRSAAAKADADGGFDCFGGIGLTSAKLIGAWAPGGPPVEVESNIATSIKPGTLFVMQIHYHPAGATGQSDSTRFQMRFLDKAPQYELVTSLIGNFTKTSDRGGTLMPGPNDTGATPEFRIPANAKAHTETMEFTLPKDLGGVSLPSLYVYGAGTHMHYVGRDMKIEIERASPTAADPASECLVQTPEWDFNWQRGYAYNAPIDQLPRFSPGDKLKLRCTYDNTMQNPFVLRALSDLNITQPRDVVLGETTLDEMCLGAFQFIYARP